MTDAKTILLIVLGIVAAAFVLYWIGALRASARQGSVRPTPYELLVGPLSPEERDRYCVEAAVMEPLLDIRERLPANRTELDVCMRATLRGGRIASRSGSKRAPFTPCRSPAFACIDTVSSARPQCTKRRPSGCWKSTKRPTWRSPKHGCDSGSRLIG